MSQKSTEYNTPRGPLEPKAVRAYRAHVNATICEIISPRLLDSISTELRHELEAFFLTDVNWRMDHPKEIAEQAAKIAAKLVPSTKANPQIYQDFITKRILETNAWKVIAMKRAADDAVEARTNPEQAANTGPNAVVEQRSTIREGRTFFAPQGWTEFLEVMDRMYGDTRKVR